MSLLSRSSWPEELLDEKVDEERCLLFSLSPRLLDLLLLPSLRELLSRLLDRLLLLDLLLDLRVLPDLDEMVEEDRCLLLSCLSFSTLAFSIIISSEYLLLQLPIVSSSFSTSAKSPPSFSTYPSLFFLTLASLCLSLSLCPQVLKVHPPSRHIPLCSS